MSDSGNPLDLLKQAFELATTGNGAEYDFRESSATVGGVAGELLLVEYRSGNEYIRLDILLDALRKLGKDADIEFRGRGEPQERSPKFVAGVRIEGEYYQLVYFLPGTTVNG